MLGKAVKLSTKALKLLSDYSESKGITPSEALEQLVPKTKKQTVGAVLKKASRLSEKQADTLLAAPRTKVIPDREAGKFARAAVRRYRAK
jgi:prolyl-tRNA editing enzyme YbaK/EbsC (Cys-tRNA(Pro) deacylase)